MSKLGNLPLSQAFVTDTFSGNGSTTAFTMSVAPAATSAVLVAISGVLQDPSTYSVAGTTLTFSAAPPSGTGNISARYLGIPASGVATTAYRTLTEFTATSGQTTFSVPSYVAGFIAVYRNGAMLGTADYTATNGTTVVLAVGAVAGDLIAVESFYVSSVLNAIPNTAGAVQASNLAAGAARTNFGAGAVLQVVQTVSSTQVNSTSGTDLNLLTATITPASTTNKILIRTAFMLGAGDNNSFWMKRNSTKIGGTGFSSAYQVPDSFINLDDVSYNITTWGAYVISWEYLDSPSSTSAITYTLGHISSRGSGGPTTLNFNRASIGTYGADMQSNLTLMEIAA